MDRIDGQEGEAPPTEADARDRARLDRRAESLRANLKRRKVQSRERAEAKRPASVSPRD